MNTVANTLRRLAPRTSLRQCAHRPQNSSIRYAQLHPEIARSQIALPSAHRLSIINDEKLPTESLTESPNAIQYP